MFSFQTEESQEMVISYFILSQKCQKLSSASREQHPGHAHLRVCLPLSPSPFVMEVHRVSTSFTRRTHYVWQGCSQRGFQVARNHPPPKIFLKNHPSQTHPREEFYGAWMEIPPPQLSSAYTHVHAYPYPA